MTLPWFKMYSEFAHDAKVQMMSEAMQRRLVMLFCLRCSETLETLHETEIMFHMRFNETDLKQTKQLFIEKGFIDDGWNILNWSSRQQVISTSTERVKKHRNKKIIEKQYVNCSETLETLHETNETLHETLHETKCNVRIDKTRLDLDKKTLDVREDFEKSQNDKSDHEKIVEYALEGNFAHLAPKNLSPIATSITKGATFVDWKNAMDGCKEPSQIGSWNYLAKIAEQNGSDRIAGLPQPRQSTATFVEPTITDDERNQRIVSNLTRKSKITNLTQDEKNMLAVSQKLITQGKVG